MVEGQRENSGHSSCRVSAQRKRPCGLNQHPIFQVRRIGHLSVLTSEYNIESISLNDPKQAIEILPNVHRAIERLKNWIRGTRAFVSTKHLNRYLAEFEYRFNRRFKGRRETIFEAGAAVGKRKPARFQGDPLLRLFNPVLRFLPVL